MSTTVTQSIIRPPTPDTNQQNGNHVDFSMTITRSVGVIGLSNEEITTIEASR